MPEDQMGPLESEVVQMFREAKDDSILSPPDHPPSLGELAIAFVAMVGRIEAIIRRVASEIDQSHQTLG